MLPRTLYQKLWDSHLVREEPDGTALIYIDRHLVHEVTSPQAFEGLEAANRKPWRRIEDRNFKRCFSGPWPGCVGHLGLAGQCSE